MTTTVAGVPNVARDDVLGLVAWNVGHGWSHWHIELTGGRTLCGQAIPDRARFSRRTFDSPSGVMSDQLCQLCIEMVP